MLATMLGAAPDTVTVPEATFKWPLMGLLDDELTAPAAAVQAELSRHWQFPAWHAADVLPTLSGRVGFATVMDRLATAYADHVGTDATTWIDHTPGNIRYVSTLLAAFPDARVVHLVRDGRAATASVLPLEWGPSSVPEAAAWWSTAVAQGLAAQHRHPDRVTMVRYEDLVEDPAAALGPLCDFLELPTSPAMVAGGRYAPPKWTHDMHQLVGRQPDRSRIDGWRTALSDRQVEVFEALTQELLPYLGYPSVHGAAARPPTRAERVGESVARTARRVTDKVRRVRLQRRGFTDADAEVTG